MCGVFGIIVRHGAVPVELLEKATLSLAHRGPDDSGSVIIRETAPDPLEIGLGNRRLAVLDLSPHGHQPMQDPETGNWIVYNGEIYNFHEIRRSLEQHGITFRGHSDTEVVLKAFGKWGPECLRELRGMFAFAIWDAARHRLFLARDPLGIKPLYYSAVGDCFVFASETRTLLGTGLVPRRVDGAGLISYLTFGSSHDPVTVIEGISALPAGRYAFWQQGNLRQQSYWDAIPESPLLPGSSMDRKKLQSAVADTLSEAIRMQMVSDVPVGVFLSGGIDSSSIVAMLQRASLKPNTFSIVFRESVYDESQFSRLAAQTFGTEHQEILVSVHDAREAISPCLQAADQPSIDGLNTFLISRQTRAAGIKVALTGLGGDEVFAGYSSFRTVPQMERFVRRWTFLPRLLRAPAVSAFRMFSPGTDENRKLYALLSNTSALIHPYFLSRMLFTPFQTGKLLRFTEEELERANEAPRQMIQRTRHLDPINRVSYLESRCYMLNTLLRDSDVMSMAHGLELRVPLIDSQLVKQVMALPGRWKLNSQVPKPMLVEALAGSLPDEIVHRPKRGFTLPFEHWLRGELRSEVESALQRVSQGPLAGRLNQSQVAEIWADFLAGRTSWSRVWSLYVLERWCELNSVTA
jgi:asparagine synthase (glutamine-hydrolysing)